MRIAMIGLGRMGGNMARRLRRANIEVIGYNRSFSVTQQLAQETGLIAADSLETLCQQLTPPRIIWLMLPAGEITETHIEQITHYLQPKDIIVDGGNTFYQDTLRRNQALQQKNLYFVDAGTSGGVWGLENGYCIMLGGEKEAIELLSPALNALTAPGGWAHVGPSGAGHFSKMIHNGIEYGMMQAIAEGFEILKKKKEFDFDMAQVAKLWQQGSVVRSWLLDLAVDIFEDDQEFKDISAYVSDSGEGRWSAKEAVDLGVPAYVITQALFSRFASQDSDSYSLKMLAKLRQAFGGHALKDKEN